MAISSFRKEVFPVLNVSDGFRNESSGLSGESSRFRNELADFQNQSFSAINESFSAINESFSAISESFSATMLGDRLQSESSGLQSESSGLQSESSGFQSESFGLLSESKCQNVSTDSTRACGLITSKCFHDTSNKWMNPALFIHLDYFGPIGTTNSGRFGASGSGAISATLKKLTIE